MRIQEERENEWVHEIRKQKRKAKENIRNEIGSCWWCSRWFRCWCGGFFSSCFPICRMWCVCVLLFVCVEMSQFYLHRRYALNALCSLLSFFFHLHFFLVRLSSFLIWSVQCAVTRLLWELRLHRFIHRKKKEKEKENNSSQHGAQNGRWFVCRLNNEDRLNYRNELSHTHTYTATETLNDWRRGFWQCV